MFSTSGHMVDVINCIYSTNVHISLGISMKDMPYVACMDNVVVIFVSGTYVAMI